MAEWFESWFASEEYLSAYQHRDQQDADLLLSLILSSTDLPNAGTVLDLACGSGRHAIALAKKGLRVTGLDLSQQMLTIARMRAEEAGLEVNFVRADVRNFALQERFDLAINVFTSFGYFQTDEENFKVFEKVKTHLKPGGFFAFDYFNKEHILKNLEPLSSAEFDDMHIEQRRSIRGGRVEKEITISREGDRKVFLESVKLYDADTLINELRRLGFSIKGLFGNYQGQYFSETESQRLIIIARL